ncbi:MAG TPA: antibiotic biosynthesis monooxygenase [Roseiflexaceae bacterium]|nr:antibiotic biosynthesis monooxygenase [Roseiflexaceae bacterium]
MFVVLFEVFPHQAQMQQYLDFAKLLRPELEQINGFIDNERFANVHNPKYILSLSTWRDEKALIRWRTHALHHEVQEQGRALVFADYRLRVGEVTADSAPPAGHEVRQQRFDATETSSAKVVTVIELDPPSGDSTQHDQLVQVATIDPAHAPTGWVDGAHFTSIYRPGKRAMLAGWTDTESAHAWHATQIAPIQYPAPRSRFVRVIRAYGMRDRAEAPQFYPHVPAVAMF